MLLSYSLWLCSHDNTSKTTLVAFASEVGKVIPILMALLSIGIVLQVFGSLTGFKLLNALGNLIAELFVNERVG